MTLMIQIRSRKTCASVMFIQVLRGLTSCRTFLTLKPCMEARSRFGPGQRSEAIHPVLWPLDFNATFRFFHVFECFLRNFIVISFRFSVLLCMAPANVLCDVALDGLPGTLDMWEVLRENKWLNMCWTDASAGFNHWVLHEECYHISGPIFVSLAPVHDELAFLPAPDQM